MRQTILIIEDEPSIADNIRCALELEGFEHHWVTLGEQGLSQIKAQPTAYDLIILDIGLPDISGFEVCKQLRQFSQLPIVFLSARGEEIDRVVGLEIGADDYMVKPFSPRELVARVKLRIKKPQAATVTHDSMFEVAADKHLIKYQGQLLNLTAYEFGILNLLLNQPERVYSREQLMAEVWSQPEDCFDRVIDTHIKTIRAKLKDIDATSNPIVTHRGLGYSIKLNRSQ